MSVVGKLTLGDTRTVHVFKLGCNQIIHGVLSICTSLMPVLQECVGKYL